MVEARALRGWIVPLPADVRYWSPVLYRVPVAKVAFNERVLCSGKSSYEPAAYSMLVAVKSSVENVVVAWVDDSLELLDILGHTCFEHIFPVLGLGLCADGSTAEQPDWPLRQFFLITGDKLVCLFHPLAHEDGTANNEGIVARESFDLVSLLSHCFDTVLLNLIHDKLRYSPRETILTGVDNDDSHLSS